MTTNNITSTANAILNSYAEALAEKEEYFASLTNNDLQQMERELVSYDNLTAGVGPQLTEVIVSMAYVDRKRDSDEEALIEQAIEGLSVEESNAVVDAILQAVRQGLVLRAHALSLRGRMGKLLGVELC